MQLSLQGVIPNYLAERLKSHPSDVWGKDVCIAEGAYVFIQAPSGTGKTTLMHLLYGLRKGYSGTIKWGSVSPEHADDETMAKLRTNNLSIVFQDLRLFPELTTLENMEIKRLQTNTVSREQVASWLDRVGLGHKKNEKAGVLSFGEQQRVAIVRALTQPFDWLLMDEPYGYLDQANRERANALVGEIVAERKAGVILADLDAKNFFQYTQTLKM